MVLNNKLKKVLFVFFLIYLFFNGFIFSFLIPPFQKPDEFEHFKRTISVANLDLNCQKKKHLINKNLFLLVNNFYLKSLPFNYHFKMPFSLYRESVIQGKTVLDVSKGCQFKDWIGYLITAFFIKFFPDYQLMVFCFLTLLDFSSFYFVIQF